MIMFCCVRQIYAEDFEVDGIYYNITDSIQKTVAVTYHGNSKNTRMYKGIVIIPDSIVHNSSEYAVTTIGVDAF